MQITVKDKRTLNLRKNSHPILRRGRKWKILMEFPP